VIGRENGLEPMNGQALAIAKKVAAEGDALVAGVDRRREAALRHKWTLAH
jgi:hypothetical protein